MYLENGQYVPDDNAIHSKKKSNSDDFINCEFEIAKNVSVKPQGNYTFTHTHTHVFVY